MPPNFRITPGSNTPIYQQIVDQIRHAIAVGSLSPGDLLPSVRNLAEQLLINPNTVQRAYGELARDGDIEAQPGRGNVVTRKRQTSTRAQRLRRIEPALETFLHEAIACDFSPDDIAELVHKKLADFKLPAHQE